MGFIWILLAHWLADFVLQTRKMAVGKSSSFSILMSHVGIYSLVILIFGIFLFGWKVALSYALINGLLHGFVDFFTSKASARYKEDLKKFFVILGFDQFLHTACLYVTYIHIESLPLIPF